MYAAVLLLSAAVHFQESQADPPASPVVDAAWVEGLGELLPPGTAFRFDREGDRSRGRPRGLAIVLYSTDEAVAIRAEGATYEPRFDELFEASRAAEGDEKSANVEARREFQKAFAAIARAEDLRRVVSCGNGRLAYIDRPRAVEEGAEERPVIRHVALAAITQVTETAARYAERTGTPLPAEPAVGPAADNVE